MPAKDLSDGRIMQTAFVTDDIEKSVRDFGKQYDIGGWAIIRNLSVDSVLLRGKPCTAKISAAVAFQGDMMYEFIQPLDDLPSVYRDKDSNALLSGFHHLARIVPDLSEAVARYEAAGMTVAMDVKVSGGGRAIYMEGDPQTGMIELLEGTPSVDAFVEGCASLEAPLKGGEVSITYW